MLSANVDEHQKDWDVHLSYVMMAYRSTKHETTGCTPNSLMLGREVATPLDVMYEMPPKQYSSAQMGMGAEITFRGST
jgi:hypothetical protein